MSGHSVLRFLFSIYSIYNIARKQHNCKILISDAVLNATLCFARAGIFFRGNLLLIVLIHFICFPLFSRHCILSGGNQRRSCLDARGKNMEMKKSTLPEGIESINCRIYRHAVPRRSSKRT